MSAAAGLVRAEGMTAVVSTHDPVDDRPGRRVIQLADGRLSVVGGR